MTDVLSGLFKMELFPCSGGMAKGFAMAGLHFDMAVDIDENAVTSYQSNLGHRPIRMDVRDLLRMIRLGWRPPRLDLLVADPPCTPWSRAGKRLGTEDERDMIRETAEIIAILRPRAYLIGNVPGLQDASSWDVVQEVIGGLSAYGYCTADYISLDAADYGVPQHRVRPFWFGHMDGPCIRWPVRTHGPKIDARQAVLPGSGGVQLQPYVTCRQALQHLPVTELGRPVRLKWKPVDHEHHKASAADAPARTLTKNTHSDGALLETGGEQPPKRRKKKGTSGTHVADIHHPPSYDDEPAKTVRAGAGGGSNRSMVLRQPQLFADYVVRQRDDGTVREHSADEPAHTLRASRSSTERLMVESVVGDPKHPPAAPDEPAPTIRSGGDGHTGPHVVLEVEVAPPSSRHGRTWDDHPTSKIDEPAQTIRADGGRPGRRESVLSLGGTHPVSTMDEPGKVVPASMPGNGGAVLAVDEVAGSERHRPSQLDEPAKVVRANRTGSAQAGQCLEVGPAPRLRNVETLDGQPVTLDEDGFPVIPEATFNEKHPPSDPDEPAATLGAKRRGAQSGEALEWPWDRPATTVHADPRLAPPGHHPESGSFMSPPEARGKGRGRKKLKKRPQSTKGPQWQRRYPADGPAPAVLTDTDRKTGNGVKLEWPWERPATAVMAGIDKIAPAGEHAGQFGPNAIVLSEKAAAILQGFPPGWVFAGKSKKARWSQLGQAMPPGLAYAVATSVMQWFARAGSVERAA